MITQKELNKLLRYWQKRLRLQDWNITARIIPNFSSNAIGQCSPFYQNRECLIKIDPEYLPAYDGVKCTIEELLIHELLEIYFINIVKDNKEVEKDMAINMIAEALIKERYQESLTKKTSPSSDSFDVKMHIEMGESS